MAHVWGAPRDWLVIGLCSSAARAGFLAHLGRRAEKCTNWRGFEVLFRNFHVNRTLRCISGLQPVTCSPSLPSNSNRLRSHRRLPICALESFLGASYLITEVKPSSLPELRLLHHHQHPDRHLQELLHCSSEIPRLSPFQILFLF
jgi:hypothetical protein